MFEKVVVIDGKDHLFGRLASIIAKQILSGQRVVCVRCEEINISGSFYRNKLKFLDRLNKSTNTNPAHGPFHMRGPARIFYRTIRGMIPHKSHRGKLAMERLKCFDGIPLLRAGPYLARDWLEVPGRRCPPRVEEEGGICCLLRHQEGGPREDRCDRCGRAG